MDLTTAEKIKILCIKSHISISELARRTKQSPQNLSGKIERNNLQENELKKLAKALDCKLEINFVLKNGDKI
jgi:transcriptional regulator with XRE-family HTH domain